MTPGQTRMGLAAFGLLLVGLLIALWWSMAGIVPAPIEPPSLEGIRPGQTRRGKQNLPPPQVQAPPVADVGLRPVTLTVRVGSWKAVRYDPSTGKTSEPMAMTAYTFAPSMGWPDPTEAPLPDHPVTDEVLARVGGGEYDPELLVELADEGGTTAATPDILDRPWDALVAMEAELARSELNRTDATAAFDAEHNLPDRETEAKDYWAARRELGIPGPLADMTPTLELAQGLIEKYPDDPISDYARLYEINAFGNHGSALYDPAQMTEVAMDAIRTSKDPLVLDGAAHVLSNTGGALALTSDDLDLLSEIYEDPESSLPKRQLAQVAMQSAIESGDLERAKVWTQRHEKDLRMWCRMNGAIRDICHMLEEQHDAGAAYVSTMTDQEPTNWRAAISAVARRCGEDHEIPEPALTGEAVWNDGWQWSSWSHSSSVADCVASTEPGGPKPKAGQALTLNILGP